MISDEIGDLDKVQKIVKLTAFVNCVDGFAAQVCSASIPDFYIDSHDLQPKVVNGASDFLVELFGDQGRHARSAVGTNSLPLNVPVEIEAIVRVSD